MAGAIDEDTARSIARGREAAGSVLAGGQAHAKKLFILFLLVMLGTLWALREFVWDALKRDLLYARMPPEVVEQTTVVAVTPFDVILLQLKIGLIVGLLVTIPALVWVSRDALRRRGWWPTSTVPRWKVWAIGIMIVVLFAAGVAYAYRLFFPLMFEFLASNAVQAGFTPTYSIVKWTEFIIFLMLSFGLAAQLPLAMSALASAGIVRYETFRDKWRYAVMGIFVFGAVFSPPDPFTQVMWAVPLIALYWLSLGLTKLVVLSQQAGEHVPLGDIFRTSWNVLAGTVVLAGGGTYLFLRRGGLAAINDVLRTVGSDYRAPTADELSLLGLPPSVSAGLVAGLLTVVAVAGVTLYLRIQALEDVTTPAQASVGEPAAIDLDALSTAGVRAAPVEAFADLTEAEAVAHAQRAMEADQAEKARLLLDRFDEAQQTDLETDEDDADDPVTSTVAGMMDAFTEEETTEEDVGGYYYDIAFIVDSLTSKAIWLVGVFVVVMVATFAYLYSGGIKDVKDSFLTRMPAGLGGEVNIVTLHPVEALIFEVKFSVLLGAVATVPIMVYFAWPALQERGLVRGDRATIATWGGSIIVALVGGSLLGFFYIAPEIISWLAADALTSNMVIAYRINNFGWLVILTTVGIGLLAEIPITMVLFHHGGIVSYETFRRRWRVPVVGAFVLGGVLTPQGVFTMLIVAIPSVFAYGVGLALLWVYANVSRTVRRPRGEAAD